MHKNIPSEKHKHGIASDCGCSQKNDISFDVDDEDDDDLEDADNNYDDDMFDEMSEHPSQKVMSHFMTSIVEAINHRMTLVNELTKLAVSKTTKDMDAKEVFAVFKEATTVINEAYPLKNLMGKMGPKEN